MDSVYHILDLLEKCDYHTVFQNLTEMQLEKFIDIISQINPKHHPIIPAISIFRGCYIFHDLTKLFEVGRDDFIEEYGICCNLLDNGIYTANYSPIAENEKTFNSIIFGLAILTINLKLYPCPQEHVFQPFAGVYNYKGFNTLVQLEEKYHVYLGEVPLKTEFIAMHIDPLNEALQYMNNFGLYTTANSIKVTDKGFLITDALNISSLTDVPKQYEDIKLLIRVTHKYDLTSADYYKVVCLIGI